MKNNNLSNSQVSRYENLKNKLGNIGIILQGTITPRTITRDNQKKPGRKKVFGPYYQWTFKVKGKTTTVNLSASQAKSYQKAINNYRKMRNITQKMKDISLEICENSSVGVIKRNPKGIMKKA